MKIKRSSRTTLKFLTETKRKKLHEVMDEYSSVVNSFIDLFWGNRFTQKDLTKEITNLPDTWLSARMRQCAAREALGMVEGAYKKADVAGEEPFKSVHTGRKMILSAQTVRIEKGRNSFDLWLVLHSVGNGIKIYIPLKRHRHINWFQDWKMSNTVVIHRQYVQFSFEKEIGCKKTEGQLIGIDVGINHLLATSTGKLIGSEVKSLINTIKRKKQGSKGCKRSKKTLSYYLHKIVKDFFRDHEELRLIVVERLNNLKQGKQHNRGKTFRKTLSNWNYRELLEIIQMRSEENRVSFRSVNPYKTSQQCPHCSHTERDNRSGEKFQCSRCGYANQADVVGSLNILDRFISGRYGAAFQT